MGDEKAVGQRSNSGAKVMLQADLSCGAFSPQASLGMCMALEMDFGKGASTWEDHEMLQGEREFL